jgi:hypothetical protein
MLVIDGCKDCMWPVEGWYYLIRMSCVSTAEIEVIDVLHC